MYQELTRVKFRSPRSHRRSLIPRRNRLAFGCAAAGVLLLGGSCSETRRPDVILISVDTLRADRLGAYGCRSARTSNIDSLAARGVRFVEATTPFPRTTPAIASLFTGLWPQHHGSREIFCPFESEVTLAEILRDRGYFTIGITANPAAGRKLHFDRGFELFAGKRDLGSQTAERVTDQALAFLRESVGSGPVFLWVHYMDPHFPYLPPSTFRDQPEAAACRRLMEDVATKKLRIAHVEGDLSGVSSGARDDCLALYDAEVAYVDSEIGRLLDGLRELARLDGAIVVLTSDHGENFGEAGLHFGHGSNVHDAGLRIPLVVTGPGLRQGGIADGEVFRLEDLLPTLLTILGVPASERPVTDGWDLSARLIDSPSLEYPQEPVALAESGSALNVPYFNQLFSGRIDDLSCINGPEFSLCAYPGGKANLYHTARDPHLTAAVNEVFPREMEVLLEASRHWAPEEARERTARTARLKLVEYPRLDGGYRRALYDLRADPLETRDVSTAHPAALKRLVAALDEWSATISPQRRPAVRDEAVLESLRSLGYIE